MAPQTNLQMPVVVNAVEMPSIRHKSAVTKLGLAQVILGVLSVLIGVALIVMMVVVQSRYFISLAMYTFGEGIWCGIWIIVAGVLGMSAGKQDASVCLINCHMGFGIVAILFAALLSVESGIHAGVTAYMPFRVLSIVQAINAGISFFSLIVSTSICCCCSTPQACCGTSCCVQPQGIPNQVIVFNQNPAARPAEIAQYIPANSPPAYFASVANQADTTPNEIKALS
ncbi:unnamed protein product [Clavelina lepadiformis]|uniref:Uncharacterized protein n=1 Tax=Clavelina lepadiformis TaxID=159417 RepID=A0ABP0GUV6_CLALP